MIKIAKLQTDRRQQDLYETLIQFATRTNFDCNRAIILKQ